MARTAATRERDGDVESPPAGTTRDRPTRWWNGLLLGALGMLAFSGTLPATRLAVASFGPTVLTCSRIVIAAVLGTITLLVMRGRRMPERRHVMGIAWTGLGL